MLEESIRVLLVDDHELMRQLFRELLAHQPGIDVVGEAANGREAIEKAMQLQPDVVLMDVSMPNMDGMEATGLIKAAQPDIRVIGLTMHEKEYLAGRIQECGMDAVVSKCATSNELLEVIHHFVGTR